MRDFFKYIYNKAFIVNSKIKLLVALLLLLGSSSSILSFKQISNFIQLTCPSVPKKNKVVEQAYKGTF